MHRAKSGDDATQRKRRAAGTGLTKVTEVRKQEGKGKVIHPVETIDITIVSFAAR
jgi:hypothetical protein